MKYENVVWLVESYLGEGEEVFCDHVEGHESLSAAADDATAQLTRNPDAEVRIIKVTESMRDNWRLAELERADQDLLGFAR